MVSKLCCLGPLFKQQGKYYPRKNEQRATEQLEQMTWQDSQHDEAEYPYEWLKSASTRKHRSSRGRRRRFLSRIRTVHAVGDPEIDLPEDFIFNSIVANEDLSCKESDVTESAMDPGVPEGRNDITKGQSTNISSALTDNADAKEHSPPTSLTEEDKKQKTKGSKYEKDIPSASSQTLGEVTKDNTELLEIEQRCADTTAQSPPSSSATCSASPSANNPIANTQKDTSCDQDASKVHQAHQQAEENIEDDGRDEEHMDVAEVLITPENVRDYLRLDEDRHEERMRDLTRGNRSTVPCGQPLEQSFRPLDWYIHQALQRQNQVQRENNQSLLSDNGQIVYHPTTRRPQPHVSLGLPQQPHQRSHNDHRVRQLSDIEQIQRTLHQYHTQRRSRADEAEQGDRRHEGRGQRRQQYLLQRLDIGGEVGTARNNAERMRENIVRELRQQAHRPDQREGYVSRVMAMVRQRHSQQEQNADDPAGSPLNNAPPDLERRVRPAEIDRIQRLNPHPPRRRRRCQKHYKGTVFQLKKE